MTKEDLNAINEIVMKRSELIDELNNALFDDNDGKRDTSFLQTNLNWEQWAELAPYMDFGGYHVVGYHYDDQRIIDTIDLRNQRIV